jgi:hypothetical protein
MAEFASKRTLVILDWESAKCPTETLAGSDKLIF